MQKEEAYDLETVDKYVRIGGDGGLEVVPWRKQIYPYELFFDDQFVSAQAGLDVTPGAQGVTTMYRNKGWSLANLDRSDLASPVMLDQIVVENSSLPTPLDVTVMMKDMGDQTQFMNQPIHIDAFAGTAQLSGLMAEPMWLPTNHALRATFTQVAGAENILRQYLWGKMFFPWAPELDMHPEDRAILQGIINKHNERRKYMYPFWLTTEQPVVLPAGGSFEVDGLVGDDGHFEAHAIVQHSTGAYLVNVLNPDTKQSFTNSNQATQPGGFGGGIDSRSILGNARNPTEMAVPWLVPAGKRLRFQFADLSGAPNNIFFAFRGFKVRSPLQTIDEVKRKYAIPDNMKMAHYYAGQRTQ